MVNYRKLFLQAFLSSLGDVPHPRATIPQLEMAIKSDLVKLSAATGTFNFDPEVPDSYLSVIIPALMTRGVKPQEISKVVMNLNDLANPGSGAAAGTIATTASSAENETVLDNLGDVLGGIISLDLGETVTEIVDVFGDFFSGGGFW